MTTSFGGQASTSYPAEGEMVGIGARRKNIFRTTEVSCRNNGGNYDKKKHLDDSNSDFAQPLPNENGKIIPSIPNKRVARKHVYDEIAVIQDEMGTRFHIFDMTNHTLPNHTNSPPSSPPSSIFCNKPKLPPKPSKYVLRDKCLRHVYQTIELPVERKPLPPPPPLPDKPFHLQKLRDEEEEIPPPLPPRVANKEAIKKRYKLDQEYFENLRKSVDEDLLDLAEEGDLPVPLLHNEAFETANEQIDQENALANGTLGVPGLDILGDRVSMNDSTGRRHSLPPHDISSTTQGNSFSDFNFTPLPVPPARALSLENEILNDQSVSITDGYTEMMFKATESPHPHLAQNFLLLKKCGWYWGSMTWQEAEALLADKGEGAFLMRDSQNPLHLLTVTVRSSSNTIHHIRVEYSEGKFQLYEPGRTVSRSAEQCVRHSNIEQFIKLAMKHTISGSFLYFVKPKNMGEPPIQIRLLTPVSRLSKVKSLQYYCRITIRHHLVTDSISDLTMPQRIKEYLLAGPYYDAVEEQ